jgi:hypothetical protein
MFPRMRYTINQLTNQDFLLYIIQTNFNYIASIAQLGERQTEDLKVAGSIPARSIIFYFFIFF